MPSDQRTAGSAGLVAGLDVGQSLPQIGRVVDPELEVARPEVTDLRDVPTEPLNDVDRAGVDLEIDQKCVVLRVN